MILKKVDFNLYFKPFGYIILGSLVFGSITSLLYLFGLPTFRIVDTSLTLEQIGRFGGIYGGSNVFANAMALFLILVLLILDLKPRMKFLVYLLAFAGWIASGNRAAILTYILVTPFLFVNIKNLAVSFKRYLSIFLLTSSVGLTFILLFMDVNDLSNSGGSIQRLAEQGVGNDIRGEIIILYSGRLLNSNKAIFFGMNPTEQTAEIVDFSDNSILLFLLDNGLLFSFGFIFLLFFLIRNRQLGNMNFELRVYIGILFVTLGLNNAILWDFYVYTSLLGYFMIRNLSNFRSVELFKKGSLTG